MADLRASARERSRMVHPPPEREGEIRETNFSGAEPHSVRC
jgi:hypothetical protein